MATSLAFMIQGREEKLEMPEANTEQTIDQLRAAIVELMSSNGIQPPESPSQIRLIYSGKILKGGDVLKNIINTSVKPPYTMQIMIRPAGCEPEKEQHVQEEQVEDSGDSCCLLI